MIITPKVSVIMAVYNAETYLEEAIDSILRQTFTNFEFVIINDASTDRTEEILSQYTDERIRVLHNEINIGLTKSLNRALMHSKGEYIARMDGDDISLPTRLEKQVDFLEKNLDVYLISCSYREFGTSYKKNIIAICEDEIKAQYLFGSVLPHPGFMFRRSLVTKHNIKYNESMKYAQDYDFQVRISRRFHVACIPEILLYYRVSHSQISIQKRNEQRICANQVRYDVFNYYKIPCNKAQIDLISKLYYGELDFSVIEYINIFLTMINIYMVMQNNTNKEAEFIINKVRDYLCIIARRILR